MSTPFFSIVIPTLNEERDLPHLLSDLAAQTYRDFEVIHVDGSSTDKTVAVATKFSKKIPLTTISVEKRNVSYQRNTGSKKATGEWIIFMDADNRLPNYFLDGIKYQIARQPTIDAFTTWIEPDENSSANRMIANAINTGLELYHLLRKESALGAMIGVHKTALREVSFDETQQIFEDSFFIQALTKAGFKFAVFREPRYQFSLRRFRKEGSLKMVTTVARAQLRYLQGKDFISDNYGYTMSGGDYHHQTKPSILQSLNTFILEAPKKQLEQARKIITSLTDLDI